jgi:uncharacterized protein (DUF1499 family)
MIDGRAIRLGEKNLLVIRARSRFGDGDLGLSRQDRPVPDALQVDQWGR